MKYLRFLLPFLFITTLQPSFAQDKENEKIDATIQVLKDFGTMKESIPHELLQLSEGIIIVPGMINAGFVLGGKRGKGIAMVKNEDGSWSDPAFITLTGGSIGFQIGVQSVDLVLIFKHRSTLMNIGKGTFTLGGDISATAGPVGRSGSASTDYKMEAEVYSYSKSKGLFAGISLNGSSIHVDDKANASFYGEATDASDIFEGEDSGDQQVTALKKELTNLYDEND